MRVSVCLLERSLINKIRLNQVDRANKLLLFLLNYFECASFVGKPYFISQGNKVLLLLQPVRKSSPVPKNSYFN